MNYLRGEWDQLMHDINQECDMGHNYGCLEEREPVAEAILYDEE